MNRDAKNRVALKSREQAQLYSQSGNVGRAFAHFLVAFNLVPEWKEELKENFSSTLCAWGRQLELQKRYKDLFDCYEQAVEIFPNNEKIICNLGAHLFRLGHSQEAAHYFHRALGINNNYLPAYRNLQNVCNLLVERWHFRMLNDAYRNEAYREAIVKKVRQGFNSVLDIGTGTGLLSLYAVSGGASDVHACDYSPTMCAIARQVFEANKVTDNVILINKLSNHLKIPRDLPQRKSLVVTETMDCGLLGEQLLQTLLHAWSELLRPVCSQFDLLAAIDSETPLKNFGLVIPFEASVWAVPIRSHSLAQQYYLTLSDSSHWSFKDIWLYSDSIDDYDTENLRNLKDCTFLGDAMKVFTFDFNNPVQLKDYYEGKNDEKCLEFQYEGTADALAIWFDAMLDEDIMISSSPFKDHKRCCWDQAVFQFKKPQLSLKMKASCGEGKLNFEVLPEIDMSSENSCSSFISSTFKAELAVCAEVISFMNNTVLQSALISLPTHLNKVKNVLDLSPFPTLGLRFLELYDVNLVCVLKSDNEILALKEFMRVNNLQFEKVKCLKRSEFEDIFSTNSENFDFIMNNVFETTGELSDMFVANIPKLMNMLSPGGVLAPVSFTIMCQLIDSEWIRLTASMADGETANTFKIAEFINTYKVSQQLDVVMRNVSYVSLTEATPVLQLSCSELASESCRVDEVSLPVTQEGLLSAVPVWFQYQLCHEGQPLSTFSNTSHVNQMVFIVDPPLPVSVGDSVTVHITFDCGILRIKVLS